MQFYMYLPDASKPGCFVIADADGTLILRTENPGRSFAPAITDPSGDTQMLKVRYSSVFGDSFIFSDVTGNRGTYHVKEHTAVIEMHMMAGRWDIQYYKPEGTIRIHRLGHRIADATLDPDYALYFHVDMKDSSELLFVVGSLLAVSYFLS